MQQGGAAMQPDGAAQRTPSPEPAAAPEAAQRSREALRGRERGER
jgi:hypothetical protein